MRRGSTAAVCAALTLLTGCAGQATVELSSQGAAPVSVASAASTGAATTPTASASTTSSPRATAAATAKVTAKTTARTTAATAAKSSAKTTTAATKRYYSLRRPGASLPSGATCAAQVKAVKSTEVKGVNKAANHRTGHKISGATGYTKRVDGRFTGTTEQIIRWAACKWGLDENTARAQAAVESWWRQGTLGDFGTDASRCPAGHGLGVDGTAGQCPESYGLLQVRYPYNTSAFPMAARSTAFNIDYAFAQWRSCYEGELTWLNTVERGEQYAKGDSWGCLGVWFSGRWHTAAAEDYITKVKKYRSQKIWTTKDFRQP